MNEWSERALALKEAIITARPAMDGARRMEDSLAAAFAEAGFFRLCVPKAYGGLEAPAQIIAETLEALAETDASAAWVAMIGATSGAEAAFLEPAAAREIFSAPNTIVTGVYAPMGKAVAEGEGYRVSGQWKWNSGGHVSTWLSGGCLILEGGKPVFGADGAPLMRMVLVPKSEATLLDTWHTGGLKGTGSGDMAIKDVFVPRARTISLTDDQPRIAAPLYKFPIFGLLALGIAAVASGNCRGALAEFAHVAANKRMPNGRSLAERSSTQNLFAHAHADYAAARAWLFAEVQAAWAEAEGAAAISTPQRARLRLACTHMVRTGADVARRLQDAAGGASVFVADPLYRRSTDAQTMTAHIMTGPSTYDLTGRVLLGGEASIAEL
ncbi:MAG: hydrolase [Hyphomonadaceae bacterium]|nr:hydrolase [Hyphomonadaceae bacterium]